MFELYSTSISSFIYENQNTTVCGKFFRFRPFRHIHIHFLEAPEIVPFSFGADVVNHREFAQLTCVVRKGDEPLSITWSLKGDDISSDPSMSTNVLGSRVSMLTITSVEHRHSGEYTCRAENPAGIATHSTELRVNGNLTRPGEGTGKVYLTRSKRYYIPF